MTSMNYVAPDAFVRAMTHAWETNRKLLANKGLRTDWHIFADTLDHYLRYPDQSFHVLAPKTGTGKTMGLELYLAMLSDLNQEHPDKRTGTLVVARTCKQCDEIVANINAFAGGRDVAVASYQDSGVLVRDCADFDVLVITHEAYRLALHMKHEGNSQRWEALSEHHGDLCIVDEAPHGLFHTDTLLLDDLRTVLSWCDYKITGKHEEAVDALRQLADHLEHEETKRSKEAHVLWEGSGDCPISCPSPSRFADLERDLCQRGAMSMTRWLDDDMSLPSDLYVKVHDVLASCQRLLERWAVFLKAGDRYQLRTSELVLPPDVGGHFVLDATATVDPFWQLFKDRAHVFQHWTKPRSYSAVSLHIRRKRGTGKSALKGNAEKVLPVYIRDLETRHPTSKSVLCVPEVVETKLQQLLPVDLPCNTMHWGAIAGRNDLDKHEVIGLLSLPYRDQNDYLMWHLASCDVGQRGRQLGNASGPVSDLRAHHIALELIQAINRIRCRRPIDEVGGCLPCDVYVVLPKGPIGDAMLDLVCSEMPGVKVEDWKVNLDQGARHVRPGTFQEQFLDAILELPVLEMTTKELWQLMRWPRGQIKEIHQALRDTTHSLSVTLREAGVSFWHNGGRGRASTWHLSKT